MKKFFKYIYSAILKCIKWLIEKWKYLLIISFITTSILLLINFSDNTVLLAIFSGLLGSFCVSFAFELINDINRYVNNKKLISNIRKRELAPVNISLSLFIMSINMREDNIINKFKLKSSFSDNNIDIENFKFNMFVFKNFYESMSGKFNFSDSDKNFIIKNIEYLFMKDTNGEIFENGQEFTTSDTYSAFHEFNQDCISLYKKMEQLNIDYQLNIFSVEEINAMRNFSENIGLGAFTIKLYFPFRIINIMEQILKIEPFVKANFTPYYKSHNLANAIIGVEENIKKINQNMKQYIEENDAKAIKYLNDFLKNNQID